MSSIARDWAQEKVDIFGTVLRALGTVRVLGRLCVCVCARTHRPMAAMSI